MLAAYICGPMNQFSLLSGAQVRSALLGLPNLAMKRLGVLSGVSQHTLIKIRDGVTTDPGIDTVARFWPHLEVVRQVFLDPADRPPEPAPAPPTKRLGRPPKARYLSG